MLQFLFEGQEYTTRARLLGTYDITPTSLHYLIARTNPARIVDGNKFYFLKSEVEHVIETYLKK